MRWGPLFLHGGWWWRERIYEIGLKLAESVGHHIHQGQAGSNWVSGSSQSRNLVFSAAAAVFVRRKGAVEIMILADAMVSPLALSPGNKYFASTCSLHQMHNEDERIDSSGIYGNENTKRRWWLRWEVQEKMMKKGRLCTCASRNPLTTAQCSIIINSIS